MATRLSRSAAIAAAAVLLVLAGCKPKTQSQSAKSAESASEAETSLPLPTLEGTNVTLDQYKGKVVLVNFWATWCQPCRIEIPWLIELNQKYASKGLVILGVAMDDEGKKAVQPWVEKQRFDVDGHPEAMPYQILLGNDKIADKFGGIIGLPTSLLYSRDGKKVKTIIGLINRDDIAKALESQL